MPPLKSIATPQDIATALALLTRLPFKARFERAAQASWAYPMAGFAVVAIAGVLCAMSLTIGVNPAFAAGLWLATSLFVTGALHEDGLADTADGLWGGFTTERRLEIMKDSQIGSYGVLALVLSIVTRWAGIWLLFGTENWFWTLMAIECLSRAFMPALMHQLPHARQSGLSHAQGKPPMASALLSIALGFLVALFCVGWSAFLMVILGAILTAGLGLLAQRKIGGQTGDILGASQQISAIAMLIVAV